MQANRALFLYGYDVTDFNKYINFQNANAGPVLTATLNVGNYTATQFMAEVKRAMEFIDGTNTYTVTLDRTVNAGTSNRMYVSTNGSFLSILFGSGINAATSPSQLMGFLAADYTGMLTYGGTNQSGTILIPEFAVWNYLGPDEMVEQDGVKNVTSTGIKETLVFAQQQFFQGEWRYITNYSGRTQLTEWQRFLKYATQQLKLEYSPSIQEDASLYYEATLESTPADGNGMKYKLEQMVSAGLFRFYQTGLMKFRVIIGG